MGTLKKLFRNQQWYDFIRHRRRAYLVSAVMILVGLISVATQGLAFSIEFRGGVVWEVPAGDATVTDAQELLAGEGLEGATVQLVTPGFGNDGVETLRITSDAEGTEVEEQVTQGLAELTGADINEVSLNEVGPSWGQEISRSALRALVFFFLAIALYISLRFEWKMAIGALSAVFHDIIVTVGIYSLFGLPVSPATAIAFLTILGYSIYDTIVVFDKVGEDIGRKATGGRRSTYGGMVNTALNDTLMRTVNTTVTSVLPILSLVVIGSFLGATTLQDFALVLLIGMAVGAYSTFFIASPVLVALKEREPEYAAMRAKEAARTGPVSGGGADDDHDAPVLEESVTTGARADGPAASGVIEARGRKKGKRR